MLASRNNLIAGWEMNLDDGLVLESGAPQGNGGE